MPPDAVGEKADTPNRTHPQESSIPDSANHHRGPKWSGLKAAARPASGESCDNGGSRRSINRQELGEDAVQIRPVDCLYADRREKRSAVYYESEDEDTRDGGAGVICAHFFVISMLIRSASRNALTDATERIGFRLPPLVLKLVLLSRDPSDTKPRTVCGGLRIRDHCNLHLEIRRGSLDPYNL